MSYLPQPGTAKIKMFSSRFWRISFKKAKHGSGERYRFMLSGFLFILMVLYKLLFSCHKNESCKTLWVQNYQTQEEIKHCLAITLSQFLSSKRKIPGSVDSVSTVVVLCEWNPQFVRYTTLNFAFNSIWFLLNISFVLFDTSLYVIKSHSHPQPH